MLVGHTQYCHTPSVFITLALMLFGMNISSFNVRIVLKLMKVDVHVDTAS